MEIDLTKKDLIIIFDSIIRTMDQAGEDHPVFKDMKEVRDKISNEIMGVKNGKF